MAGSKRGPKTLSGKQTSARNAVSHGLRSTQPIGPQQLEIYDSFLNELVEFYKPEGPIERLQLERIATCKAKLQSLHDLEKAKLELLTKETRANQKTYVDKMTYLDPLVRGMMKELLLLKSFTLPCHLNLDQLTDLVEEMSAFSGELQSDEDLTEYLPKLASYLQGIESTKETLHEKLISVGAQIRTAIDSGINYAEGVKLVFKDKFESKEKEKTPEEIAHEQELQDYIVATQEKNQKKFRVDIQISQKIFPDMKQIEGALNSFKELHRSSLQVHKHIVSVKEDIELNQRALSLPTEVADLLMRYQTFWERRLSTLIGEFMQLQRVRLLSNS